MGQSGWMISNQIDPALNAMWNELWTHLTARMRVFTAGITSSMATSQYGLSSMLSSPTPSTETKGPSVTTRKWSLPVTAVREIPSAGGRGFSRRDVRKRVRSLKLQLFWTFPGLVLSGMFSWLGERRTLEPGGSGEVLLRMVWDDRELFILIRSRKPILLLTAKMKRLKHPKAWFQIRYTDVLKDRKHL